ncbi:DUF4259 domain-containing protein [Streptomyces sp. NPDC056084]|uniref:DUF4259 domain-containing protein n=1 Tax=unclassified Streptomyces TaxID=2593676 RepID=UPI0035E18E29
MTKETTTGTWDTGPFDNDTAGDFADTLAAAKYEEREAHIRAARRSGTRYRHTLESRRGSCRRRVGRGTVPRR